MVNLQEYNNWKKQPAKANKTTVLKPTVVPQRTSVNLQEYNNWKKGPAITNTPQVAQSKPTIFQKVEPLVKNTSKVFNLDLKKLGDAVKGGAKTLPGMLSQGAGIIIDNY